MCPAQIDAAPLAFVSRERLVSTILLTLLGSRFVLGLVRMIGRCRSHNVFQIQYCVDCKIELQHSSLSPVRGCESEEEGRTYCDMKARTLRAVPFSDADNQ
eukprot:4982267-Amphidinium_carterae.1